MESVSILILTDDKLYRVWQSQAYSIDGIELSAILSNYQQYFTYIIQIPYIGYIKIWYDTCGVLSVSPNI